MNPKENIIAFDLHGVIFTVDWRLVWRTFWRYPHKLRLIACGFHIPLVWRGLCLLFDNATDVEVYALFNKYCPSLLPFIIDITNVHKPIPESVRILQTLKARGYELHILSNVGPDRLRRLREKYPDVIGLFDKMLINNGDAKHLIKKPQKAFYEQYLRKFNLQSKNVLFIDNKKANVRVARELGFSGIHFKNPKQLLAELCKRQFI